MESLNPKAIDLINEFFWGPSWLFAFHLHNKIAGNGEVICRRSRGSAPYEWKKVALLAQSHNQLYMRTSTKRNISLAGKYLMIFLSEEIIPIYGLRELNATKLIDWSTEQISMEIIGRTGIMGKQLAKGIC